MKPYKIKVKKATPQIKALDRIMKEEVKATKHK